MCGILCICSSNLQGNVEANINCIEKVYHYIFTLSYPSSVFFGLIYIYSPSCRFDIKEFIKTNNEYNNIEYQFTFISSSDYDLRDKEQVESCFKERK